MEGDNWKSTVGTELVGLEIKGNIWEGIWTAGHHGLSFDAAGRAFQWIAIFFLLFLVEVSHSRKIYVN